MAILSKTGITTGNTVEPGHVTQSIDAFTGIEAYDISLSGSFNMTGSINGEPGTINNLTASFAVSSSRAISSSFANTASFALNAGATFPFTGSAIVSGSLIVTGSTSVLGSTTLNGGTIISDSAGNLAIRVSGTTTRTMFNSSVEQVLDFQNSQLEQAGVTVVDWNPGYKGVHITEFLQLEIVSTSVNPNSLPSGSIMLSGSADDSKLYINMAGAWKQIAFV